MKTSTFLVFFTLVFSFLSYSFGTKSTELKDFKSSKFKVEVVLEGIGVPWGFDFLPDGGILFSERSGGIKVFNAKTNKVDSIKGVPEVVASGQGGMLDVLIHPEFKNNKTFFFSYSKKVEDKFLKEGGYTTVVARATLNKQNNALTSLKDIFIARPFNTNTHHYGSRIVMDKKGYLFISVGDRGNRHEAQSLKAHMGKVIRIHQDGRVPKDNPFFKTKGALKEIWSFGHRNAQGLAFDPISGDLYEQEHGPRGGDEINKIQKGVNYGWPVITYGKEYWGPSIGEGTKKQGMKQPLKYWVPSIAPCGLAFYSGSKFPDWKGSLFSGALRGKHLNRLTVKDGKVVSEERLLGELGFRVRNVKQGPSGLLYLSVDQGKILRIVPKN
tara:strand:+ start:6190 stop:7338 length:1149 start_codon:yes stop_codon:yes gene_type:complete